MRAHTHHKREYTTHTLTHTYAQTHSSHMSNAAICEYAGEKENELKKEKNNVGRSLQCLLLLLCEGVCACVVSTHKHVHMCVCVCV